MWVWVVLAGLACGVMAVAVVAVRSRGVDLACGRLPGEDPDRRHGGRAVCARDRAGRLALRRRTCLTGLACRLRGPSLDRKLAAGRAPESSRLLAARAELIASPEGCRALAEDWQRAVQWPRHPGALYTARPGVCRRQVDRAGPELADLLECLLAPGPKAAQGIAVAGLLLTDGTGPLYDGRGEADLATVLRRARRQMDPQLALTDWS
ncbi:MAG TPA: hypothetical protein VME70_09910 [Mycobacteriales bacterium]|nr:hypothetical protein [Mycobacteriales bacterium]